MAMHDFEILLDGVFFSENTDDYDIGCNDGTLVIHDCIGSVHFSRIFEGSIGDAILSARYDLRKAGFRPLSATAYISLVDEPVAGNDTSP